MRPDGATFYLDASIYSRALRDALLAAGAHVEHAGGVVPHGTPDEAWLATVGAHGWIVLMRDQRIRYRPLEKAALKAAGVAAFVFTGGQATANETTAAVLGSLRKIVSISASERRPFLYTLTLSGQLRKESL